MNKAEILIKKLRSTPFKAKKNSELYNEVGDKKVYITEIDDCGQLALGFKIGNSEMAWFDAKDLIEIKSKNTFKK